MSDEEYYEEETTSQTSKKGSLLKPGQSKGKGELDEQLRNISMNGVANVPKRRMNSKG